MINILTIDVEDYPWIFHRDYLGTIVPISSRVKDSTQRVMDLLENARVSATFFCLGNVARVFPELIREIHQRGFEVASHGMDHLFYNRETLNRVRDDLTCAKSILEDTLGVVVRGFRAPHFNVSLERPDLIECVIEAGYVYDSSVFPFGGRRYGSHSSPRAPYRIRTPSGTLVEFPLATVTLAGRRLPVAGGGYLRHFPYRFSRWAIRRLNREAIPVTVYLHPYECDIGSLRLDAWQLRPARKVRAYFFNLHQYHGRRGTLRKLAALMTDFTFCSLVDFLGRHPDEALGEIILNG